MNYSSRDYERWDQKHECTIWKTEYVSGHFDTTNSKETLLRVAEDVKLVAVNCNAGIERTGEGSRSGSRSSDAMEYSHRINLQVASNPNFPNLIPSTYR